jgi:flagellin FlaB
MRKVFNGWLKMDDRGAIGIGAMIVFIAMILVAGIAASVLVQTSNTVQIQALQTGQQTTREVSSGISVFEISGEVSRNASTGNLDNISKIAVTVKARPGSGDIDLNNTYLLISDGVKKALLRYNTSAFKDPISGNMFSGSGTLPAGEWNNCTRESFGIGVLQDEDNSIKQTNPVLNRGDKAVLFLRCNVSTTTANFTHKSGLFGREIPTRTDIFGRVIPEIGAAGVISFTSPMTYVDRVYKLQ